MPYKLEKSGQRFFVVSTETGKKHSKKPLPKARAEAQRRALYMRANPADEIKGAGINDEEGAGLADYLKKAYKTIASKASSIASNISGRIQGTLMGRDDYPPGERSLIQKYGDTKIIGICIYREALSSTINSLVNVISLGQFNKVKNTHSIDDLYHLYMVITVEGNHPILVEKNEVINIHEYPNIKPDAQKMELLLTANFNYTFKQFLDNGQQAMGDKYFTYSALNNNCQNFILGLCSANPPLLKDNPHAYKFIQQETQGLTRDLGHNTSKMFDGITTLAARLNVLANGKGFNAKNPNHHFR